MLSANIICDARKAFWMWLLCFAVCVAELGVRASPGRPSPAGSSSVVVVVGSAVEERQNLSCYSCNSQLEGEGCRFPHNISRAMIRTCPASHRYCTVTRVDYSVDPGSASLAFSIERSCSEQCTTECVAVGERLRLYLCRSCCQGSLCNTGNGTRWSLPTWPLLVAMAAASFVPPWGCHRVWAAKLVA
ncbi:uncharacterized protein LOC115314671 [Ixodes scapularis]|uniref:uncharacterized protein LOC115314671 n=1 Tax=Ixodes scapularis TaxID=6945 RepID=UPI001A9E6BAB|nr:uncharacterized protein LOC115314671 [Ixodes scapularis]